MNIEKMTDLEIMQAIVRGELPHPTMSKNDTNESSASRRMKSGFQCYCK